MFATTSRVVEYLCAREASASDARLGRTPKGMDFDGSLCCAELAWDRHADVVYDSRTHRMKEQALHAAALRESG
jgi:hypothetical protein